MDFVITIAVTLSMKLFYRSCNGKIVLKISFALKTLYVSLLFLSYGSMSVPSTLTITLMLTCWQPDEIVSSCCGKPLSLIDVVHH